MRKFFGAEREGKYYLSNQGLGLLLCENRLTKPSPLKLTTQQTFKGIQMKSLFLILSLGFVSISAHAETVDVVCEKASDKRIDGAESIALFVYELDTTAGTAQLKCSEKLTDKIFCGNYRADLSKALSSKVIEGCRKDDTSTRQMFNFYLVQEDEFDNFVTLVLNTTCDGRENKVLRDSHLQALITSNSSHEQILDSVVVNCKVK